MNFHALFLLSLVSIPASLLAQDQLVYPIDVAVGPQEEIYIADLKLPGIWKVVDGKPEVFFQASKTFRTPLNAVRCVTVDTDGILYAGDSATREVYAFGSDKKPLPLTNGWIGVAADLIVDGDEIIVSDLETQRIWQFPKSGGEPKERAVIAAVRGLAKDSEGNLIAVTATEDPVRRIKSEADIAAAIKNADEKRAAGVKEAEIEPVIYSETILAGRPFEFSHHCVIVADMIYVSDNYASTIWKSKLEAGAKPEPLVQGDPLNRPVGLCQYKGGFLVADPHAKKIFQISSAGEISVLIGSD